VTEISNVNIGTAYKLQFEAFIGVHLYERQSSLQYIFCLMHLFSKNFHFKRVVLSCPVNIWRFPCYTL